MNKQMNDQINVDLVKECVEYLSDNAVLKRLMSGFREKYASLGKAGGNVVLSGLKEKDIEVLEGFFGKNYHGRKSVSISAEKFQNALNASRYTGISLEELLAAYFQGVLKSKKEQRQEEDQDREAFFREAGECFAHTIGQAWLLDVIEKGETPNRLLNYSYKQSKETTRRLLAHLLAAINGLPVFMGKVEYLAVFAARTTGNPHYFDEGKDAAALLQYGIQYALKQEGIAEKRPLQRAELYLMAGICKDDISNYTVVYGVRGWKRDGSLHMGMEGFRQLEESMHLALVSIAQLERINCGERIYVFENPSVYGTLIAEAKGNCGYMCLNGQPNLAGLLLLDLLAKEGTKIFYSGDFDPEGLGIAQRLKDRYGKQLSFFLMNPENYIKVISLKDISERRLKMLDRITDSQLLEIAAEMKLRKRAAYQESLLEEYIKSLPYSD